MRGVIIHAPKDLRIEDIPVVAPEPNYPAQESVARSIVAASVGFVRLDRRGSLVGSIANGQQAHTPAGSDDGPSLLCGSRAARFLP